ncbi:MAG: DUF2130 domain-containing protein [Chitinophagaceae bacterium]|nr:DUF2130 domain-containing protein [Chitinophagaceae bacterium]
MTSFNITCPNCQHEFEATSSLKGQLQKEVNEQARLWQLGKVEEFNKQLAELKTKAEAEKKALEKELEEKIKTSVAVDFENKLKDLQKADEEKNKKLQEANKREAEFLEKERNFKNKEAEMDLIIQRKLLEERQQMAEQLQKNEALRLEQIREEFQFKLAEKEKQLEDQIKLVDQMKQKAEQGSMQMQGEVQELMLEELLANTFPFDKIEEVGKGVKGADCIQIIHNRLGSEAGKIIYESKRTKDFSNEWIDKLKANMRSSGADIAVIVTQALPKDIERFGEKEGVYICTFAEVRSVAAILRNALLKIFEVKKSQQNQGDKMVMLYDYLVGNEFGEQWKAIREGFMSMKLSIQKERDAMERIWKAREKQLEKVLLNATHIRGSIEGIAGADSINMNLLDDVDDGLLLE